MKKLSLAPLVLSLTYVFFGIAEFLIGIRIILKLFNASTNASFVRWIYETSQPLLKPFLGAFPSPSLEGGFIIEFSAIFALIIYSVVAYLISEAVGYLATRSEAK